MAWWWPTPSPGLHHLVQPINESFSYQDGEAQWQTRGEKGNAQRATGGFYVPNEWGAAGATEALVQSAMKQIDGELPLFPAGTARVEKLTEVTVPTPDGEQRVSLFGISGIDFTPLFAWFDDELSLVARDFGRMGMVPQGWDPAVLEVLAKAQAEQNALMVQRQSDEHIYRA